MTTDLTHSLEQNFLGDLLDTANSRPHFKQFLFSIIESLYDSKDLEIFVDHVTILFLLEYVAAQL
jgi:hypothetical protein